MKLRFLVIFVGLFVTGCAVRSVYVPSSPNVPLFDERKQVQANGYLGINTFQLQLAHNPGKAFFFGINNTYGSGIAIYEGMIGWYGDHKNENKWRYEVQAGGGHTNNFAQVEHAWLEAWRKTELNIETISIYNKVFVQPSLGFFSRIRMYKLDYSFSLGSRLSYMDFKKFIYRESDLGSGQNGASTTLVNKEYYNKNMFLLEPCLTNKVGMRNFYVVIQVLGIIPYSQQIDIRYTKFSPVFLFSAGLQYNFIFKNKTSKKPLD